MENLGWLALSVLTGVLFGIQAALIKLFSHKVSQFVLLTSLFIITGLVLFPLSIHDVTYFNLPKFLSAFLISLILNSIAYILLFQAIKISPISIVIPFVGLTPVFLILSGYVILNETITGIQLIGILLVVLGGFILQLPYKRVGGQGSFLRFFNLKEKGIPYVILVAFIWSITASVEKIAVLASSPKFYGMVIHLSLGFVFMIAGVVTGQWLNLDTRKKWILPGMLLLGLTSALLAISQLTAIKLTKVTYVISFKRAGVLVSSLSGFLFFKEKNYLKAGVGTIMIIAGSLIITLLH